MTPDDALELIDTILRLRREVAGIARSVDVAGASFTIEWRAAQNGIQARLDRLAALEASLEPVLAPSGLERLTLEQLRAWIVRMADRDADGPLWPAPASSARPSTSPRIH